MSRQVSTLQDVLTNLQTFISYLMHCKQPIPFNFHEWVATFKVIDRLNWNMRLKTSSKIYNILSILKDQPYELDTWHLAYKLFHCIGDWWCIGHNDQLYTDILPTTVATLVKHFESEDTKKLPVILTMTSCKRLDLLSRTINSMLVNILDITKYVREWIVIDDNSSEEDRTKMQQDYPFIRFIFKTPEEKGHPKSMNMLHSYLTASDAKYNFHVEDDFEFWYPDNYISKLQTVIDQDECFGQALVDFEYTEDQRSAMMIWNRDMFYTDIKDSTTKKPLRYFIHEFFEGDRLKIEQNHLGAASSMYWPHFSFRVGLTKLEVYKKVGEYNTTDEHFEREYAYRYVKKNYKTTMLDCCYCTHIGRRTYERGGEKLNAYDLNSEQQFGTAPKSTDQPAPQISKPSTISTSGQIAIHTMTQVRTYVMNLERRPERLANFIKRNNDQLLPYAVFNGIDGKKLKPNGKTQKMFETGDYNFRRGIVGCASSHINIWLDFLKSAYTYCIVLEDDVTLTKNFNVKLFSLLHEYQGQFDIMMLHWNPYNHIPNKEEWDALYVKPQAELWDVTKSCQMNMGSGAGYLLSRHAARHLLNFINKHGSPNAIDWVLMKQPELRIMYSKPKLVIVDCWQNNGTVQSDIQLEYDSVKFNSVDEWLANDVQYWKQLKAPVQTCSVLPDYKVARHSVCIVGLDVEVPVTWCCKWYTVGNKYKVIVPDSYLSHDVYKQFAWFNNRVNSVCI